MREHKVFDSNIKTCELRESNVWVYVSKFENETLKDFIKACESVINSGQSFLPIIVDSFGGQCYTLLGMVDFLNNCGVKVITVAECKAMSAGSVLFSCGEERYIGKNATILIHEVINMSFGKDSDIQNDAKHTADLTQRLFGILDKNTGHKKGFWYDLCHKNKNSDLYLTAEKAKKLGLATHIGIPIVKTEISVKKSLVLL